VRQELDINAMFNRASVTIEPDEDPVERDARLEQDKGDRKARRMMNFVVFVVIIASLIAIGGLCAYEGIFDPLATPDTKRWAQTALSALFTGAVSFVLGQSTATKK
jgi:hypothetical protein